MTNSIKMTNSINAPVGDGLPGKTAGCVSMISMLAISVGMAAAPAHAQDMTASDVTVSQLPVPAPPVLSPQPAPTSPPTMEAPLATSVPAVKAETTPPVTPDRADDLARKGGFDAETVAPEALAQIERERQEQQERKAAAEKAAAAKAAAAKAAAASIKTPIRTSGSATNGSVNTVADNRAESMSSSRGSSAVAVASEMSAIPNLETAPEVAASPEAFPGDSDADWNLLAALAALLGIGGAGAYAASRRRKSKGQKAAELHSSDPVEADIRPTVDTAPTTAQPMKSKLTVKAGFAEFVANLPPLETPLGKADRNVKIGQRRVAAAPRPYLAEANLSRTEGYFTADVDAMPTPQNPFLTRQKRLKRARYLDGKLAGMKALLRNSRAKPVGEMQISRPLEPAFS